MKKSLLGIVLISLVVLLANEAPIASAQSGRTGVLVIGGSNQRHGYSGRGRYVRVSGRGNHVEISGTITTLRVTGNNNQVSVNSVRQIEVAGRNNQVTFARVPGGVTPRIYQRPGNLVIRAK